MKKKLKGKKGEDLFFACWNIRGLNDPLKRAGQEADLRTQAVPLWLLETKVKEVNKDSVLRNLPRDWKAICNLPV